MYFIEKILRLFTFKQNKKIKYIPRDIDSCEHLFLPVDSSGEVLACTKCGKLIYKKELDKSN